MPEESKKMLNWKKKLYFHWNQKMISVELRPKQLNKQSFKRSEKLKNLLFSKNLAQKKEISSGEQFKELKEVIFSSIWVEQPEYCLLKNKSEAKDTNKAKESELIYIL